MPSVFISYAHESEPHRERVLDLARALLQAGWEVRLDRFTGHPSRGWPRWMADQIEAADQILCICTATYRTRFDGDQANGGLGVSWEAFLLTGLLYRDRSRRKHVHPVWPSGKSEHDGSEYLPLILRPLAKSGVPFDIAAIVKSLGVQGGPRPEPAASGDGQTGYQDGSLVMDPHRLLGSLFRPITPRSGAQDPHDVPPSTFLRPEHAIVRFHGRERELEELGRWCQGDGVRVRLLHGAGGAGKTRLALELAARRAREGWRTGPLTRETHTDEQVRALVQDPIPLLVIIDYAETRLKQVADLLRHHEQRGTSTMRVLLLARHDGDWVDSLTGELPGVRDLWDTPLDVSEAMPVSIQRAAEAFATYFTRPVPLALPPDQDTPLGSHIAALLAVRGLEGSTVDDLVDHEKRYLNRIADECGVKRTIAKCLPDAVALITLAQGIPMDEASQWLKRVDGLGGLDPADLRSVKNLLFDLYPGSAHGISPVLPDRVGEVYVTTVDKDSKLAQAAVEGGRAIQALTVLTRHAQKKSRAKSEEPLRRLLESKFFDLAEAVVIVAIQTGDPVGQIAAQWLEKHTDLAWAERVNPLLPQKTTALRELAVAAVRSRLAGTQADENRAPVLTHLGLRLSDLGQREEALKATRQAADIYRQLAQARPDAFLPDLAVSLNNLGGDLSSLGHREEALEATREAVKIRRQLAQARPDAFLPNLASSLNNLGNRLSDLGHREEALEASREAAVIYRPLAQARPDAFLPDLANSLGSMGLVLLANGNSSQSAAAFAEGLGIALGLMRKLPSAHRSLASALFRDYVKACQTAGLNPDPQLISEARSLGL